MALQREILSFPRSDNILEKILSVFDGEKIEINPSLQTFHKSSKTIEVYTHVSSKDFMRIKSHWIKSCLRREVMSHEGTSHA